jgi:drug/metabolite transporter (DMT)-like permease
VGLVCALVGGGISAWTGDVRGGPGVRSNAAVCLGAAAAIGTMLASLHAAGGLDPYWATATEHVSTCASAGLGAWIGSRHTSSDSLPRRAQLPTLVLVGIVGAGGDLAYVGASHHGALSIVAAIASLYPVTTIALGRLLRGHQATGIQLFGIILALTGAAVIGAASG